MPTQQPVPDQLSTNAAPPSMLEHMINRLTGTGGEERYQTWPEKTVREALSAAHDALNSKEPLTSQDLIQPAMAMSAVAGTGGVGGADATLGSAPFLRPALKYEGKIYKAPVGGQHLDAIPADVYPKFQQMAMNGEDINHFNFGFMNHKGQFLDREKALDYAIKEGLLDPNSEAARANTLTSTLMSDSSKPGAAIEANVHPNIESEINPNSMVKLGTLFRGTEGTANSKTAIRSMKGGDLGDGVYMTQNQKLASTYGGGPKANISDGTRKVHSYDTNSLYPEDVAYLFGGRNVGEPVKLVSGNGIPLWEGKWSGTNLENVLQKHNDIKAVIGTPNSVGMNQISIRDPSILKY